MFNKSVFIIAVCIILCPKPALAFLSPSTLSLVAASLGSIFWSILIGFSVYGVLIYKKAKKYPKLFFSFTFLLIIFIGLVVNQRIAYLKELNNVYDQVSLMENEIDLNVIAPQDLADFKLFQIKTTVSSILEIEGAAQIEKIDLDLIKDMPNILANIDQFSKEHNILRQDKILFICEGGKSTRLLATLFKNAGYDAYFARLKTLTNDANNLLKMPIRKKKTSDSSLVVAPIEWIDNARENIYFTFDLIKPTKFLSDEQINKMHIEYYRDFNDASSIKNYNIMCSFNLHCVFTKYYLDYLGITHAKIFKIPVSQEKYYDGNLYKLPKSLRSSFDNYNEFIEFLNE